MSDTEQLPEQRHDRPGDRPGGRPSGRHPVNIGHLVMGLAFVGLVAVWALVQGGVVDHHDVRWLLPLPWVVAGIVGLVASTLTSRDRWGTQQTGWVGEQSHWQTHHTGWVGAPTPPATPPAGSATDSDTTVVDDTTADSATPEEDR